MKNHRLSDTQLGLLLARLQGDDGLVWLLTEGLRRLLQRNSAVLPLTVLLLAIAIVSTREVATTSFRHLGQLRKDVTMLLNSKHEPRRETRHIGLAASLLSPVNKSPAVCPPTEPACIQAQRFLRAFSVASRALLSPKVGPLKPFDISSAGFVRNTLARIQNPATKSEVRVYFEEYEALLNRKVSGGADSRSPLLMGPCEDDRPDGNHKAFGHDGDFGPMFCTPHPLAVRNPRLFVSPLLLRPNQAKNYPTSASTGKSPQSVDKLFGSRASEAIALSLLIAPLIESVQSACPTGDTRDTSHLVQAYFISPDAVMNLWGCGGRLVENHDSRTRHWAAAGYYESLLRDAGDQTEKTTAAYIDHGGFGIVRTTCRSITAPIGPGANPRESRFVGVVCADTTMPLQELKRAWKDSVIYSVKNFSILAEGFRELGVQSEPRGKNQSEASLLERALRTRVESSPDLDPRREIVPVLVNSEPHFWVPVRSVGGRVSGLLVHAAVKRPLVGGMLLLALISWAGAALALTLVLGNRARDQEARAVANVLRNLDAGILVVDENDIIVAVNDRGEQILDIPLPKIGRSLWLGKSRQSTAGQLPAVRFEDIIKRDKVFVVREEGHLVKVNYATIDRARQERRSSTYHVELVTGGWIIVSGAPIETSGNGRQRQLRSFGIIQQLMSGDAHTPPHRVTRVEMREQILIGLKKGSADPNDLKEESTSLEPVIDGLRKELNEKLARRSAIKLFMEGLGRDDD